VIPDIAEKLFDENKQKVENVELQSLRSKIKRDNKEKLIEIHIAIVNEPNQMLILLCSDITEKVEKNKRELSEKNLYKIIDQSDELICKIDSSGKILFANSTFIQKLGYSKDELYEGNFFSSIFQEGVQNTFPALKVEDKSGPIEINLRFLPKQGYPINTIARIVQDTESDNDSDSYYVFLTDIEDKIESESELNFYESLFRTSLDGIAVEHEGRVIKANDSFANIFGYDSATELRNKDFLDLVSNDDVLKVAEYFRLKEMKKNAPDRFEFLGRKKDGAYFYTELSVSTFEVDEKLYLVLVTRDVTERKRAQKVIRESEEKYRNITENIDDFLYTFERSENILRPLFYTSAVENVTGYSQAEFLGDSKLFLKIIHPDDFQTHKKKLRALVKGSFKSSVELEFRIINKHGNIVWVRNKINFIRNNAGEIQKLYGLVSDITLKRKAEEELKQSAVDLQKLNETKDRFISIVSHDLRTPFSSILGFTDLLSNDETLNEQERKQYINYIQDSSKSMLSLVNSLLDWTRLQTGRIKFEPEKISAVEIIDKSIGTVRGTAIQKGIEIIQNVESGFSVFVDKSLTLQLFNNLLSNAVKFSKEGDTVMVSVKRLQSSHFIEFSVNDTGSGIKPENIEKLFNVDTKYTSEGTAGEKGSGLGLSLAKEIIEKHGGRFWVESKFGEGSEFRFTLPTASANILIVDNNPTDRILYSKILKNLTPEYEVDVASNGKEALEKIQILPPALIITENKMPEMNGYEFIQELIRLELIESMPVVVLSSNINRSETQAYSDLGVEYIFQKPVNLGTFKQALGRSLRKGVTINNKSI
jgi:PAS domain S-box-containing protein